MDKIYIYIISHKERELPSGGEVLGRVHSVCFPDMTGFICSVSPGWEKQEDAERIHAMFLSHSCYKREVIILKAACVRPSLGLKQSLCLAAGLAKQRRVCRCN